MSEHADVLIAGGTVVTLDGERRVIADGAVAIGDGAILDVGPAAELTPRWDADRSLDARGLLVTPGLVNAHVHLTGPSLFPGIEPDDSPLAEHFPRWVLPAHAHSEPEDERAAARLVAVQMLRQGTTAFLEAGACRHVEAVLDGLEPLGVRGAIGAWASDLWPVPGEGATPLPAAAMAERIARLLELTPADARLRVVPNVCGHDACSDDLYVAAAALAREGGLPWTFHMSAMDFDRAWFHERAGEDPLVHLDRLGVLDERAVVGHGIYLTDAEVAVLAQRGTTVAFCPGTALRVCTGVTRAGRHPDLEHVALGTDTQNACNHLDLLRTAGLACGLYGELRGQRADLTAERALEWLTLGGARALGLEGTIGAIAPGMRADLALFDPGQPVLNVANALVHGSPRARHVFVDGRHLLVDGRVPGEEAIEADAARAAERVAARAGIPRVTGWAA